MKSLSSPARFPKAQKRQANMLHLALWAVIEHLLYARQKDDHGIFPNPQEHQNTIKWCSGSDKYYGGGSCLRVGVQKRLYNYMTFELGLQVLVSYPQTADKGTGVQSQEGMKVAWKRRASGTPNARKQLPGSNRDDCEGPRNMNEGTHPKNSTRAGRPWHMSGNGVPKRWLS